MIRKLKLLGIIAIVAVFGFSMTGCTITYDCQRLCTAGHRFCGNDNCASDAGTGECRC